MIKFICRAKSFADKLINETGANINITMVIKQRILYNEISKMELVGKVSSFDCIIIDDLIDTAGTVCMAAEILKKNGARKIYAFATHGVFSGNSIDNINKSQLDAVYVTNTIPLSKSKESQKIKQLSVGILIAEAIRRMENKESISEIFKH